MRNVERRDRILFVWEQAGISILLFAALVYGVFVEGRATLTINHNTDLGVYLAAAEAVRENGDLYSTTYNHDHYMYQPFLAILLAHVVPPPDRSRTPASVLFVATVSVWPDPCCSANRNGIRYGASVCCRLSSVCTAWGGNCN